MPRPRFSHRILAQPPHSIYTRFITPTMHPHSSLAWAIHCLCCSDHCRPPSSSQRCPSRLCVAPTVPCESMPCPCLTKQCQASAQPCRSPRCPHISMQFLTSPWPRLALHSRPLPCLGRAGLCHSSPCSCHSHRRRPDQGCAVSVLSKFRLFCAPCIANHISALPLQTHSHHGHCIATQILALRLLLHSVRRPGNATDISATHCPG